MECSNLRYLNALTNNYYPGMWQLIPQEKRSLIITNEAIFQVEFG
jgi:hypothetical protein